MDYEAELRRAFGTSAARPRRVDPYATWEAQTYDDEPPTPNTSPSTGDLDLWACWWAALDRRNLKYRQGRHARP